MKRRASSLRAPTDAELDLLGVLWRHGPSTVRDVHDRLPGDTGYTTTLKLLQNMLSKGLVTRDDSERQHVYAAAVAKDATLAAVVRRVADKVFGGSGAALALRALGSTRPTRSELAELKRLVADLERRQE